MDPAVRHAAGGLRAAIQAELEGEHFYLMAAQTTTDRKGKQIFAQLAAEERDHQRLLRAQLESVLQTGAAAASIVAGAAPSLDESSPIFSEKIRARLAEAHFEMTALSVGIQLELAAERHYRQAAEDISDEALKRLYTQLADWEAGHYAALLRQQEDLKEDYWHAAGFAPF
ncbi:MAG: ferritin family protein [bacterium]